MPKRSRRWWECPRCEAINDKQYEMACWNCEQQINDFTFDQCAVEFEREVCPICNRGYRAPRGMARCPYHNEPDHYGPHGYYPPMLPALYLLQINGLDYDEEAGKIVGVLK